MAAANAQVNPAALLYGLTITLNAANLVASIYFLIMLSDLEMDYINPIDLCARLNYWILPDIAVHYATSMLLLLSGQWVGLLLNLPVAAWNTVKIYRGSYILDTTEIFRTLGRQQRELYAKLAFFLCLFFYYMYCLIATLIARPASRAVV